MNKIIDEKVSISSADFRNFKALSNFSLSLRDMNILVGPNNCGKSTILSAFRALSAALRRATSRKPEIVSLSTGRHYAYRMSDDLLPISIENIHTDYEEVDTTVKFKLSNKNELTLLFPADGGCILLPETTGRDVATVADFKRAFPISVGVVPVLGPVEHKEVMVDPETVRKNLYTHRASRHFRNYWWYNPADFEVFSNLVHQTWPGMGICRPERSDKFSSTISMFCQEGRIDRELFWAGFGFQVWCQLLTHIARSSHQTILVVDEPEIYLHPDVQRQLLDILRKSGPDVLLATHSTEIMSEADPSEILLVEKSKRSAQRLKDIKQVQSALELIGSVQNITLTQLARNRRVVFFEGMHDFKLLRRFARRLGLNEFATGVGITPVKSEGAASWQRMRDVAWGIEKTLGSTLKIGAIFDRDFRCQEEVGSIIGELREHLTFIHIHKRKEIENYLLMPDALDRAIQGAANERARRLGITAPPVERAESILTRITDEIKGEIQAQYLAKRGEFLRSSGRDQATIAAETIKWFDEYWAALTTRLIVVPGKQVLQLFRAEIQERYGISITDLRIIDSIRVEEIPDDVKRILEQLEHFRVQE